MKSNVFAEWIKPVVVLAVICAVVSAALGITNAVTAPKIASDKIAAAAETRVRLLPTATEFEELTVTADGVLSIYRDMGGGGYVITAAAKGYGGDVVVTVAISPDGRVLALSADTSTETVGVGTRASESEYLDTFVGVTGGADLVDTLSGATYSSRAVKVAVTAAFVAAGEVTP